MWEERERETGVVRVCWEERAPHEGGLSDRQAFIGGLPIKLSLLSCFLSNVRDKAQGLIAREDEVPSRLRTSGLGERIRCRKKADSLE